MIHFIFQLTQSIDLAETFLYLYIYKDKTKENFFLFFVFFFWSVFTDKILIKSENAVACNIFIRATRKCWEALKTAIHLYRNRCDKTVTISTFINLDIIIRDNIRMRFTLHAQVFHEFLAPNRSDLIHDGVWPE